MAVMQHWHPKFNWLLGHSMNFKNMEDFEDWISYHADSLVLYNGTKPLWISSRANGGFHDGSYMVRARPVDPDYEEHISTVEEQVFDASLCCTALPLCSVVEHGPGIVVLRRADRRQWVKGLSYQNIMVSGNVRGVYDAANLSPETYQAPDTMRVVSRGLVTHPVTIEDALVPLLKREAYARPFGTMSYLCYSPTDDSIEVLSDHGGIMGRISVESPDVIRLTSAGNQHESYIRTWFSGEVTNGQ